MHFQTICPQCIYLLQFIPKNITTSKLTEINVYNVFIKSKIEKKTQQNMKNYYNILYIKLIN